MGQTVLIADDHPLFRDAASAAVKRALPAAKVVEAGDFSGALATLETLGTCSLLLLDLRLPDVEGFAGLLQLRSAWPQIPVAVISASDDAQTVAKALDYGASGYIPKTLPLEQICHAIEAVLDGEQWLPEGMEAQIEALDTRPKYDFASLTPAQLKVLAQLKNGRLNKQIAYDMGISEATVKAHITAIFRKLNVRSRTQAVIAAADMDLPELAV